MRNLQFLALLLLFAVPCFAGDKLKLDEVIARHLASIGTAEARAAAKSRTAEGSVVMKVIVGGTGSLQGGGILYSTASTSKFDLRFSAMDYPGESFSLDGGKVDIGTIAPNARSPLGDFMFRHDVILKEGLFGGVLGANWPLLDLSSHNARLRYEGLKKVGRRELHVVSYYANKQDSDLEIKLYFDPETFHHVMTVYSFTVAPSLSHNQLEHGTRIYYRVQEEFGNFQVVDGLTLPREWKIRYATEPVSALTYEWTLELNRIAHNKPL